VTDRLKGLTVVLEQDIRDDDAQPIIEAIEMIKGVLSVKAHVSDPDSYMATERAKSKIRKALWKILDE